MLNVLANTLSKVGAQYEMHVHASIDKIDSELYGVFFFLDLSLRQHSWFKLSACYQAASGVHN